MERSRLNALLVTLAAALGLGASVVPMARRIAAFNEGRHYARFHAEPIISREFQIGVFPRAALTDHADSGGRALLRLDYGGMIVDIPVQKPPAPNLPDLGIYDEWVKVLAVNEVRFDSAAGGSVAVPGSERLFIVSRLTPEGVDPESWGTVRRDDWVFDFHDLRPDGTVDSWRRRWPRGPRAEKRLQNDPAHPLREMPPLAERSIDYFAAMHVIPKLKVPKYKFTDTALSPRVLGWTLPVSMLSGLALSISIFFVLAPRKRVGPITA